MDVKEHNKKIFSEVIDDYKVSYLRECEKYLLGNYFKFMGKVLVLGCGAGRTLKPINDLGFDVVGIDINPDMVREAQKTGLEVYEMDACKLDFPDASFDTVFFPFHGIDYTPDVYKAVAEAKRVLKPNGVFIMSSNNRFYLKRLHQFFDGDYSNYGGLFTYRSTPLDWFYLKKYFKSVKIIYRISISKTSNWKDFIYKVFPFFSKSIYFINQK